MNECVLLQSTPTEHINTSHLRIELNIVRIKVIKYINSTLSVHFSLSAVGIQMKLEFFQRKFWTASKQVDTQQRPKSMKAVGENSNCVNQ